MIVLVFEELSYLLMKELVLLDEIQSVLFQVHGQNAGRHNAGGQNAGENFTGGQNAGLFWAGQDKMPVL